MFYTLFAKVCILISVSRSFSQADVSHLNAHQSKSFYNHQETFDGYHYDVPIQQLPPITPNPVQSPPTTASTIFFPEIIVNKEYHPPENAPSSKVYQLKTLSIKWENCGIFKFLVGV